jgi:asparagine synthase (glutamine-hydrolysing)
MCSIAGVIGKRGGDVSKQIVEMMSLMKHRGPDSAGVAISGEVKIAENPNALDLSSLRGSLALGHTHLALTEDERLCQPVSDSSGELFLAFDGQIYDVESLAGRLRSHSMKVPHNSEVAAHLIEQRSFQDLNGENLAIRQLDGDYAFAIMHKDRIVAARDPVGVKPLYYGESGDFIAFASERKALWKIGIVHTQALPPGYMISMRQTGYELTQTTQLRESTVKRMKIEEAIGKLNKVLRDAMVKRVEGLKKIGIAFSGGLDSSILAKLLCDLDKDVTLYVSGMEDSSDLVAAEEVASNLGLKLKERILTVDEIESYIAKTVYAIEESGLMGVSISLPLYAAAESAREKNIKVILSGQGCDELFGGYKRYLNVLRSNGYEGLRSEFLGDLRRVSETSLQGSEAAAMANSVELRVPYLDADVIEVATAIPPELKIASQNDVFRKIVLRKLAEKIGLPPEVAYRRKRAIQYGSGASEALVKISKKKGFASVQAYLNSVFNKVFQDLNLHIGLLA